MRTAIELTALLAFAAALIAFMPARTQGPAPNEFCATVTLAPILSGCAR